MWWSPLLWYIVLNLQNLFLSAIILVAYNFILNNTWVRFKNRDAFLSTFLYSTHIDSLTSPSIDIPWRVTCRVSASTCINLFFYLYIICEIMIKPEHCYFGQLFHCFPTLVWLICIYIHPHFYLMVLFCWCAEFPFKSTSSRLLESLPTTFGGNVNLFFCLYLYHLSSYHRMNFCWVCMYLLNSYQAQSLHLLALNTSSGNRGKGQPKDYFNILLNLVIFSLWIRYHTLIGL